MQTKRCPVCKIEKPTDLFYKSSTAKSGCSSYCKKCQNLRTTSYAREHKDTIPTIGYALKRRYGITSKDYEEMLIAQEYRCAICMVDKCSTGRNFAVDHNHTTGKVRGLLCSLCNKGIGSLRDSRALLIKAANYLEKTDG